MTEVVRTGSWRELGQSGELGRFVLLCLGVWLHAADSLVTATLVPAIVGDIGGLAYVGWTILLYQIGAIVAGAATARLCRRTGAKRVLGAAALLYGAGCVAAGLAPDMAVLLAARLVQGVGGGVLVALSYVVVQRSFPEHLWSRLFGIQAAIWGAGSLPGPLIGGLFVALGDWRLAFWCFALQAGLLWTLAIWRLAPEPPMPESGERLPLMPVLAMSAAALMIAEAGVTGRLAPSILLCLGGIGLLWAAVARDGQSAHRMFPRQSLDVRHPVGAGLVMVLALSASTVGFWAYGPLLLAILFGTNPLLSGYILAGGSISWSVATLAVSGAPLSADRRLIRLGTGLVAAAVAGLAVAVPAGSFAGMVACSLLQGTGFGLCWPSILQRMVQQADEPERPLAAAAPSTVQRIGYAVGAAATGIAANASGLAEGISVEAARAAGFWVFAGFLPVLALGLAAAWRFTAEAR